MSTSRAPCRRMYMRPFCLSCSSSTWVKRSEIKSARAVLKVVAALSMEAKAFCRFALAEPAGTLAGEAEADAGGFEAAFAWAVPSGGKALKETTRRRTTEASRDFIFTSTGPVEQTRADQQSSERP